MTITVTFSPIELDKANISNIQLEAWLVSGALHVRWGLLSRELAPLPVTEDRAMV